MPDTQPMPPPDPFDLALGQYLRKLRESRGLSQQQIADTLGTSRPNVTEAENGRRRIKVSELLRWAPLLGREAAAIVEHMEALEAEAEL